MNAGFNQAFELFGFVTGALGVWLAIKQHYLTWPVGLLNVVIYFFVFKDNLLYSDMVLQVVFAAFLLYGWYYWNAEKHTLRPTKLSIEWHVKLLLIAVVFMVFWGYMMHTFFKANAAYIDAVAFTISLLAQGLQAKKKLANWGYWVLANALYIGIYCSQRLYLTALLYSIYSVMAVVGWWQWRMQIERKKTNI
jgi:nicotinamide mononucleotide transporter